MSGKHFPHLLIIAGLAWWNVNAWAGNTGKIAGTVKDKKTGESLVGANVVIKGTNLGAATDANGNYYILRVPPGKYDVQAMYIGYHTQTVTGVEVHVDMTVKINFSMELSAIELATVTIVAEEKLVQPDLTATRRTVSAQEVKTTPGLERTVDIFKLQGGTIISGAPQTIMLGDGSQLQVRDTSIRDVHIRGGRGGEVLYMVDGVPVTHPIYGGRSVLDLNVVDVQEMELITGAFNAEYGQAQSGVVNITTRSGGEKFQGGIEYKTDNVKLPGGDYYDTHYTSFYLGGPEVLTQQILPKLGLKVPGRVGYFISGNADMTNTPYNNHRRRDHLHVLGLQIGEKQDNTGNLNAKINWSISEAFETALSFHGSWKQWSDFEWLWRNYPNHMARYSRDNINFNLRINHVLSKSTYYNLNFGYLGVKYRGSLDSKNPASFWTFYKDGHTYDYETFSRLFTDSPDSLESSILAPQSDATGFYDALGYQNLWRDDLTRTYTFKGDLTSQIHPEHLMKTGVEVQYNDIRYVDIEDGGARLSNYGLYRYKRENYFASPPGPYPEFGQKRWVFNAYPIIAGSFIQDKFEKESLIINAGMRVDWFLPGESVMKKEWKQAWEAATGLKADWKKLNYKVSPRFGISFPISVETVVFFSYGHFNQLPELQYYYRDPYSGSFTGNPHLDYEQTILYEFGFTRQIARDWAVDIKSYTKDISKQVGTTRLRAALGLPVELHDNKGYGRARGVEVELRKRYSNYTSGKLTYTVQWTNGYSSSAFEDYIRSINDFPYPIRERSLDWDVRHQIIFQGSFNVPEKQHLRLFGLKLPDNWYITVLSRFSTGQPYTPGTRDPMEAQKKENSATSPSTANTDIKLNKTFNISGLKLSIFADFFNIFDEKNVSIYYGFNNWTGRPYRYSDLMSPSKQYYDWHTIFSLMDPRQFTPGRSAKAGIRLDW